MNVVCLIILFLYLKCIKGEYGHLLENPDYWAMRDLYELSKGVLSHLPKWIDSAKEDAKKLATSTVLNND